MTLAMLLSGLLLTLLPTSGDPAIGPQDKLCYAFVTSDKADGDPSLTKYYTNVFSYPEPRQFGCGNEGLAIQNAYHTAFVARFGKKPTWWTAMTFASRAEAERIRTQYIADYRSKGWTIKYFLEFSY